MSSMYQQNAINTYAKYVSIKMLHTCHVMQFVAILCHIRLHINKILLNIATILCHTMHINKILKTNMYQGNARNTYAKYVSIKMLHT